MPLLHGIGGKRMEWATAGIVIAQAFGWSCTAAVFGLIIAVALVVIVATAWAAGFLIMCMIESFRPAVSNTAP